MKKIYLAFFIIVCFILNCGFTSYGNVINWGLNPNSHETTPEAPKGGREILEKFDGVFVNNKDAETKSKVVYLTFDLGYEAGHTAKVLDVLKENNIKAIFFLCGNYLQEEELIKRMISEGHTIGNHTDKHKDLPLLNQEAIKTDILTLSQKFKDKYQNLYKKEIRHFRPPQGRFNQAVLQEAQNQCMKAVMWSVAIVDWGKTPINAEKNATKIANRIHPGAVILSHITNAGTPEMIKMLIPKLAEKGYTIGDAGQL